MLFLCSIMRSFVVFYTFILMISAGFASAQVGQIRRLQQALPLIKDSTRYVDVLNKISLLYYEQSVDSTLYYCAKARDIANRLDYEKGIADASNNLGIVYDIKGNTQVALKFYNDAYNQYKLLGDSSNIVQTQMNIAMVYNLSGKKQKSVSNFRQALALSKRITHDSITSLAITNYMLLYPGDFKGEVRTKHLDQAEAIALKYKDVRMQLAVEQLRAYGYILEKDTIKGIALLQKTLAKGLELQLYYFSMDVMIQLGDLYIATRPDTAIRYYEQGLKFSEEKKYGAYGMAICKKLYAYYNAKNDTNKAYYYSRKIVDLYEKQTEIDRGSGIDYIEYAVKDQELKSEKLTSSYNSRFLWLAVTVCILTILSIIFLFRNWKLSKKTNEVLKMQFRQLESATEALEQSNQNYARLIKVVAHDLRNPIGAINSLSHMLLEENLDPNETREFTQLIYESSNSCIKLIADLLETDFHVTESELRKEEINVASFLQQTVKLLTFRANEKNQELNLSEPVDTVIQADRDKLLRVLNNLIVNAIKFSPVGGTIEIGTKKSQEGITISIKDNGLGIPKEEAAKIFDPFTSSKRVGTDGEQPFGLGLYITKQIVEAHHGRIWFESEAGLGTTFFVMLPV